MKKIFPRWLSAAPLLWGTVKLVITLAVLTAIFNNVSCKKDKPVLPNGNDTTIVVDTISFINDIQLIFNNKCLSCHDTAHVTGLNLIDSVSYANLVNVISYGFSPVLLVKPFDIDSSVLWHKVFGTGVYGDQMPLMGPLLVDSNKAKIEKWIEQGAKDN